MPPPLERAWLALILLSGASTVLAELVDSGFDTRITGSIVMLLAFLKARVILSRYLGLAAAPRWRGGFNLCLGLFCIALLGLYLAPAL
ncbi:cytochrome C oxidase subunit IV family protein [Oceaniglobus trochenteri]|uniref:cytochrome C oxidase subunit IV family protein n=1 Tax=Oceaniglobus trochenteri TaxID=2763260 RepID=UPI001CFFF08B|nr:cytochrome C oxidase subunit IV family protein [Oceaniglobus trochenteri]